MINNNPYNIPDKMPLSLVFYSVLAKKGRKKKLFKMKF